MYDEMHAVSRRRVHMYTVAQFTKPGTRINCVRVIEILGDVCIGAGLNRFAIPNNNLAMVVPNMEQLKWRSIAEIIKKCLLV